MIIKDRSQTSRAADTTHAQPAVSSGADREVAAQGGGPEDNGEETQHDSPRGQHVGAAAATGGPNTDAARMEGTPAYQTRRGNKKGNKK